MFLLPNCNLTPIFYPYFPPEIPDWLQELHKKLWNRKDIYQELFRSVTLTLADYNKLQESMTKLYPNREDNDYLDGVLAAKLAVLQSKNNHSVADHGPEHIVPPTHHDHDDDHTGGDNEVDEEIRSLFPFSLQYLDLSSLNLQFRPWHLPLPLLVRQEYDFLTRLLDDLPKGRSGSAIITGQPGIGGTLSFFSS